MFIRRARDNNPASTLLTAAVQTLCRAACLLLLLQPSACHTRHENTGVLRATCMRAAFTGKQTHLVRHSQNTTVLSYAERCCFPNRPSEPHERAWLQSRGAWTGSLCQSPLRCSLALSPAEVEPGGLTTHLVPFDTTKTRETQLIRKYRVRVRKYRVRVRKQKKRENFRNPSRL